MNIEMRATPGPRIRQEKKEMWLRIQQLWPRIREEKKKLWLRIHQMWPRFRQKKKKEEIVAENSVNLAEVSAREKEMWLRFQQILGVANLISKHERGEKFVLHG